MNMDFKFTEEQSQIRDSLRRFLDKSYAFERRRTNRAEDGFDADVWKQFAELGILGLGIPEAMGGFGGTPFDIMLVAEELGRRLVVEPYLSTMVLGAGLLVRAGSEAQKRILPEVVAGECRIALAYAEAQSRWAIDGIAATASRKNGGGWLLSGVKSMVQDGARADYLIASARTESGVSLFLAPNSGDGIVSRAFATHDGASVAEISFRQIALPDDAMIGMEGGGAALIEEACDHAIAALCAEAMGAIDMLIALTLDYVKTRKQFGVPIGSFQVLQHRMADMLLHSELARSMTYKATAALASGDRMERRRAISGAKFLVGRSARFIGQEAVQLHGGMGVTDELATGHYFKRLTLINSSFGDMDHHLERFQQAMAG
jgi:alkylation response protein AidB-like acyl-CoA dehydrogenase